MVLGMNRRMKQLPLPHNEQSLDGNQWTCVWDDENQAVRLICEIGGVRKHDLTNKANRAERDMAVQIRLARQSRKGYKDETESRGGGDPRTAQMFLDKAEKAEEEVARLQKIMDEADEFGLQTVELAFALDEIA